MHIDPIKLTLSTMVALALSACWFNPTGKPDDTSSTMLGTTGPADGSSTYDPTTLTTQAVSDAGTTSGTLDTTSSTTLNEITSGTSTSASSTTVAPIDCREQFITIPIVRPQVALIIDKSGSMVANPSGYWDHDGDDANNDMLKDSAPGQPATPRITRWNSLHNVIHDMATLYDNSIDFGLGLFPSKFAISDYSAAACPVNSIEVPVGQNNAQPALTALPSANDTTLKGGTPTTKGIKAALTNLKASQNDQPQYIILVTDGAANCAESAQDNTSLFEVYDTSLFGVVAGGLADGIATFVVGIAIQNKLSPISKDGNPDNVNTYEKLNELAVAGGAPLPNSTKFYDTQNELQLSASFLEIIALILDCVVKFEAQPEFPNLLELEVGGMFYGETIIDNCATETGWRYTDVTYTSIELCGQLCANFRMKGSIDVRYGCPN